MGQDLSPRELEFILYVIKPVASVRSWAFIFTLGCCLAHVNRCNKEIEEARVRYAADVKAGKVKYDPNIWIYDIQESDVSHTGSQSSVMCAAHG